MTDCLFLCSDSHGFALTRSLDMMCCCMLFAVTEGVAFTPGLLARRTTAVCSLFLEPAQCELEIRNEMQVWDGLLFVVLPLRTLHPIPPPIPPPISTLQSFNCHRIGVWCLWSCLLNALRVPCLSQPALHHWSPPRFAQESLDLVLWAHGVPATPGPRGIAQLSSDVEYCSKPSTLPFPNGQFKLLIDDARGYVWSRSEGKERSSSPRDPCLSPRII